MPVQDMYDDFRRRFSGVTELADAERVRIWDEVLPEQSFVWFESLANVITAEMAKGRPVTPYLPVFEYFRGAFLNGDDKVKECIDVSFVENLFFQVSGEKAEPYWEALPEVLKDLYVKFHGGPPV